MDEKERNEGFKNTYGQDPGGDGMMKGPDMPEMVTRSPAECLNALRDGTGATLTPTEVVNAGDELVRREHMKQEALALLQKADIEKEEIARKKLLREELNRVKSAIVQQEVAKLKTPQATPRRPTDMSNGEYDPFGVNQHDAGAKLDGGKPRMGLVLGGFRGAIIEVGEVGTFGAKKYSDNGWKDVPNGQARYIDAAFRHLIDAAAGFNIDDDSEQFHLAQAAWNCLAALQMHIDGRVK